MTTNMNRTPALSDYATTDLVVWNPRYPHDGDNAPIGGSYPMDCFEPLSNGAEAEAANENGALYLRVPYSSGGDYCGTAVELSNYRAFTETYGHIPGVVEMTGYPGGFGVVVKLSTLDNDDEMRETVNALYGYPVIDDERMSEVEREIIEDSISDLHDDARKYLIARYDDDATVADRVGDAIDGSDYQVFMHDLEVIGDGIGEYWECESPISAYFDVEKVIDSMDDKGVAELLNLSADDLIAKPSLPPTDDLSRLVNAVITQNMPEFELAKVRHEEHENEDDYEYGDPEGEGFSWVDLTVSIDTRSGDESAWGYQTGDNSYMGGAYGYPDWAIVSLGKDSGPAEVAADIRDQLSELFYTR